jgi:hypothetical protein
MISGTRHRHLAGGLVAAAALAGLASPLAPSGPAFAGAPGGTAAYASTIGIDPPPDCGTPGTPPCP